MQLRKDNARWLASQLNQLDGVSTWPETPHTSMFRLQITTNTTGFLERSISWMQTTGICLIRTPYNTDEHCLMSEISIGDAFSQLNKEQWQQTIEDFSKHVLLT